MAKRILNEEQRAALLERLAKAREARRIKRENKEEKGEVKMARRGRKAKMKQQMETSNIMDVSEMMEREREAAALLSSPQPKARKKRRQRGMFALVLSSPKRAYKSVRRKVRKMSKKGKANGQQSYAQVTSSLPIQASIEVAEGLFSLGSVGIDIYTAATKSAADDVAFPVIARVLGSLGRYASQKYLSRRHAGLAATVSHGFSAMNGDRNGNFIRNNLARFLRKSDDQGSGS